MPDMVSTLLDFNWPAAYFQTALPSCVMAADHRGREETALIQASAAMKRPVVSTCSSWVGEG